MPKGPHGQKRSADVIRNTISVTEVKDLGGGNFQVRLSTGNSDNEITHTDIVSAEGCDAAIERVKHDFAHWLEMAFDIAAKSVKPSP